MGRSQVSVEFVNMFQANLRQDGIQVNKEVAHCILDALGRTIREALMFGLQFTVKYVGSFYIKEGIQVLTENEFGIETEEIKKEPRFRFQQSFLQEFDEYVKGDAQG